MDATTLIAVGGFITAVTTALVVLFKAARKSELDSLRTIIEVLGDENVRLRNKLATQDAKLSAQGAVITALTADHTKLHADIVKIEGENGILKGMVEGLQEENTALKKRIKELENSRV